ncbi:MAG: hypothetical protein KGD64_00555 [Candidatus Heimdallarchaeota archaeon]|nr:hypothetical protein [Candidatus Heimdallarchaeota archaeon]
MVSVQALLRSFVVTSVLLLSIISLSSAYDDVHGIEFNDIIEISVDYRIIDGEIEPGYADYSIDVNPSQINIAFVNALIGMKIGEVKPSIKWTVDEGGGVFREIEYIDTTIIKLIKDATPSSSPIGQIILTVFEVILGIGVVIGAIFLYLKVIRPRFLSKKCLDCGKLATSKCSKCGSFICSVCSAKGCSNCGSRKYIRL